MCSGSLAHTLTILTKQLTKPTTFGYQGHRILNRRRVATVTCELISSKPFIIYTTLSETRPTHSSSICSHPKENIKIIYKYIYKPL